MLDLLIILFWQFIREQRDLIVRDKEIMLELEPCGGGAIIARRTVYSDRGRLVLLDWPSVDAGVAALRAALRGPSRAGYDLGIDDVVMLAQKLESSPNRSISSCAATAQPAPCRVRRARAPHAAISPTGACSPAPRRPSSGPSTTPASAAYEHRKESDG